MARSYAVPSPRGVVYVSENNAQHQYALPNGTYISEGVAPTAPPSPAVRVYVRHLHFQKKKKQKLATKRWHTTVFNVATLPQPKPPSQPKLVLRLFRKPRRVRPIRHFEATVTAASAIIPIKRDRISQAVKVQWEPPHFRHYARAPGAVFSPIMPYLMVFL